MDCVMLGTIWVCVGGGGRGGGNLFLYNYSVYANLMLISW
jgi:hypothetical protein